MTSPNSRRRWMSSSHHICQHTTFSPSRVHHTRSTRQPVSPPLRGMPRMRRCYKTVFDGTCHVLIPASIRHDLEKQLMKDRKDRKIESCSGKAQPEQHQAQPGQIHHPLSTTQPRSASNKETSSYLFVKPGPELISYAGRAGIMKLFISYRQQASILCMEYE